MNILIVYGTTEGQTRKIADFLKAEAEKMKHTVTLCDATADPRGPEGFDAVVIASSMHMERYHSAVKDYIMKYKRELNTIHSAFLSVSLTAASDDEASWIELKEITNDFLRETGWKPDVLEYAAGALRFAEYDFMKKFLIRQIAKKADKSYKKTGDAEYTDWDQMKSFLKKFIDLWISKPQTVQRIDTDQEAVA